MLDKAKILFLFYLINFSHTTLFVITSYLAHSNIHNIALLHSFMVVLSCKPVKNLSLIIVMHCLGLTAALVREGGYSFRCRASWQPLTLCEVWWRWKGKHLLWQVSPFLSLLRLLKTKWEGHHRFNGIFIYSCWSED